MVGAYGADGFCAVCRIDGGMVGRAVVCLARRSGRARPAVADFIARCPACAGPLCPASGQPSMEMERGKEEENPQGCKRSAGSRRPCGKGSGK